MDQVERIEESIRVRREAESVELVRAVSALVQFIACVSFFGFGSLIGLFSG